MNTTDTTTTDTSTTDSPLATATGTRSPRRVRRAVLAIALIISGLGMTVGVDTADAMWIGPAPRSAAGLNSARVLCDASRNQVRINIQAEPQATHPGGQWVAARYWSSADNGRTGAWSGWTMKLTYFSEMGQADVFDHTWTVNDGGNYMAYVQLLWWNGSSWGNQQAYWASRGQAGYYFVSYDGYCYT